jgi:hypothetical protein
MAAGVPKSALPGMTLRSRFHPDNPRLGPFVAKTLVGLTISLLVVVNRQSDGGPRRGIAIICTGYE